MGALTVLFGRVTGDAVIAIVGDDKLRSASGTLGFLTDEIEGGFDLGLAFIANETYESGFFHT